MTIKGDGPTDPDAPSLEKLAAEAEADPTGEGAPPAPPQEPAPAAGNVTPISGSRKRGRPPGSRTRGASPPRGPRPAPAAVPEKKPLIDPIYCRAIIQAPYSWAAKNYGSHWELSDDEADRMVPVHLAIADKYLGPLIDKHAELYTLAVVHLFAILVRTQIHFKLRAEAQQRAQEQAQEALREVSAPVPVDKGGPTVTEALRSRVRPGPKEKTP